MHTGSIVATLDSGCSHTIVQKSAAAQLGVTRIVLPTGVRPSEVYGLGHSPLPVLDYVRIEWNTDKFALFVDALVLPDDPHDPAILIGEDFYERYDSHVHRSRNEWEVWKLGIPDDTTTIRFLPKHEGPSNAVSMPAYFVHTFTKQWVQPMALNMLQLPVPAAEGTTGMFREQRSTEGTGILWCQAATTVFNGHILVPVLNATANK